MVLFSSMVSSVSIRERSCLDSQFSRPVTWEERVEMMREESKTGEEVGRDEEGQGGMLVCVRSKNDLLSFYPSASSSCDHSLSTALITSLHIHSLLLFPFDKFFSSTKRDAKDSPPVLPQSFHSCRGEGKR